MGNNAFNPEESSTYKPMPRSAWQITYGDQSNASGIVGTDTVTIGDIKVEKQAIELANDISEQFIQNAGSGLFGLGFGTINTVQPEPVMTPVENMIAQEDIPESKSLFTCYLGSYKDAEDPDKGESFFTFGGIDEEAVEASGQEIHWTPVDSSQGFWEFESVTATIDGEEFKMPGNRAMADTGTTLWMASDDLCEAIYSKIPGAKLDEQVGGYVYPADTPIPSLPQITVAIGKKQFNIEKEHMGFASVDETNTMIFGGIQPRGSHIPFDIMGDTVLMGLYAVSLVLPINEYNADKDRCSTLVRCGSVVFSVLIPLPRVVLQPRRRSKGSRQTRCTTTSITAGACAPVAHEGPDTGSITSKTSCACVTNVVEKRLSLFKYQSFP